MDIPSQLSCTLQRGHVPHESCDGRLVGASSGIYRVRPNYRTVRLNFSKALGKLVVKYPPNKGTLERKSNRGLHEERI